jgi:small GTP-binding protein
MRDTEGNVIRAKVILVGSSGVGKTSLIGAFLGGPFECASAPTVAPAFGVRSVTLPDGRIVELQCWDTAGQERFYSISKSYYRDADIALVCYDPGDVADFQKWSERIRDVTPTSKLFAIVTKCDKWSPDELQRDEATGAGILASFSAPRYVTSALNGEGISFLVEAIATAAIPTVEKPASVPGESRLDIKAGETAKPGCC